MNTTTLEMPELLTLRQAAQLLSVHPNTLRNWEKDGKIAAVRIGTRRDRRFLKSSLSQIFNGLAEFSAANVHFSTTPVR